METTPELSGTEKQELLDLICDRAAEIEAIVASLISLGIKASMEGGSDICFTNDEPENHFYALGRTAHRICLEIDAASTKIRKSMPYEE